MSSYSDIIDVSTIYHSFMIYSRRTPLFHVVQYGDDIIYRELSLNENRLVGSEVEPTTFWIATTEHDKD